MSSTAERAGNICIRNEAEADHRTVENVIRRAFWNLYVPGCAEHYVAHVMRPHGDFVPELDLVLERDGQIIGSIIYTKTRLVDEAGEEKQILTFGPVCILPESQRMGYGKMLMEASFERAQTMGYEVIVIFGDPANYVGRGFKSCRRFNVCLEGDVFPSAMLVKELVPGTLDGRRWFYHQSPAMEIDEKDAGRFDETFEPMERKVLPCQETFYIHSHSVVQEI